MKRITIVIGCLLAIITMAQAQTECESMLEAANNYYANGDYAKAAKMYKIIQEDCDSNYGGAAAKLKDCNHKLKEDADFKKCTTIAACDAYLENYPHGRYVAKVKQKRSGLLNAKAKAEEDAMYENCNTEEDCEEYLETYPEGRYVTQVSAMLERLVAEREEDEAYEMCNTESACDDYLEAYPNGRYYSRVLAKKNTFVAERRQRMEREAAKTAYMNIRKIEFANVNKVGDIIDSYGFTMYASEIMYLKPRITYNGILDEYKYVSLDIKIIKPNGSIESNSDSPSGYTYTNSFYVKTGSDNTYLLTGWGNDNKTCYASGTYKFEVWYEGSKIYQTTFVIKDKENALSRGNWRRALRKCNTYVTHSYDNSSYKGQLYDGRRSGLGMYSWTNGEYYIGHWQSGDMNGMGINIMPSGYTMNNCPNCVYYVGNYSSDKKTGGSCYDKYGNLIYNGDFYNNKPSGNYPMSGYASYKFECIEYSSGAYYVGETYKGMPHGKGVYIWSDGDMWYGEWRDGSRDGYGIYMPYQGSVSTGTWKGNTKQ